MKNSPKKIKIRNWPVNRTRYFIRTSGLLEVSYFGFTTGSISKQFIKAMSELNKLREEVQRRKKENEVERKQFEEKMVEMEKIVEGLKSRIKNLESTLRQNEVEYRNDLQKNQVNQTC